MATWGTSNQIYLYNDWYVSKSKSFAQKQVKYDLQKTAFQFFIWSDKLKWISVFWLVHDFGVDNSVKCVYGNNSFSFHGTIDTRLLCHFIVSCRFCEIILSSQETEYSDLINEEVYINQKIFVIE